MPMIDAYRPSLPTPTQESVVTFWSRPIKDRLARSSLSPGQAAKRDLARYHALIDDALPPITRASAVALTRAVGDDPGSLHIAHWTPDIWANFLDNYVAAHARHYPDLIMVTDLAGCLALLDAADRAAQVMATDEWADIVSVVHRFYRICPED